MVLRVSGVESLRLVWVLSEWGAEVGVLGGVGAGAGKGYPPAGGRPKGGRCRSGFESQSAPSLGLGLGMLLVLGTTMRIGDMCGHVIGL
jgi:hypothetical protein